MGQSSERRAFMCLASCIHARITIPDPKVYQANPSMFFPETKNQDYQLLSGTIVAFNVTLRLVTSVKCFF